MKRSYCILILAAIMALTGSLQTALAQVPARIAYQGLVLNEAGGTTLPDGSYYVMFRLYDEEQQGTQVWQERRSLEVNEGIFSLFLGEQAALDLPFDKPYWLSIEFEGQTESKRMPLAAAPYSLAARSLTDSALVAGPGIVIRRDGSQLEVGLTPELYNKLLGYGVDEAPGFRATPAPPGVADLLASIKNDLSNVEDIDKILGPGGSNVGLDAAYDLGRIITVDTGPVIMTTTIALVPLVVQSGGEIFWGYGPDGGGPEFQIDDEGGFRMYSSEASNQQVVLLRPNGFGSGADMNLYDEGLLDPTLILQAQGSGDGAELRMSLNDGTAVKTIEFEADGANDGGAVRLFRKGTGSSTIEMLASEGTGEGATIYLRDAAGNITIEMDADFSGDGRVITEELQITGGSDLSENFDITGNFGVVAPVPGMVVSIDPANPGHLTISGQPYDRMVAGVVSGAGGIETGLIMAQRGSEADGQFPVALTGRVYVYVDASSEAVTPGDLLTTSATPGHAMKVIDYGRSQGAILGKALTGLTEGRGLVLVLVSLQ